MSGRDHDLNTEHSVNPKIGDYWHEMFCAFMVVVGVHEDRVIICQTKKPEGPDHWSWDLTKLDTLTRAEFAKKPFYDTPSLADKCWCDVVPERMKWVRNEAIKALFGEAI